MEPAEMLDQVNAGWELGPSAFMIRMDWRGLRQGIDPRKDFDASRPVRDLIELEIYTAFDANNGHSVWSLEPGAVCWDRNQPASHLGLLRAHEGC